MAINIQGDTKYWAIQKVIPLSHRPKKVVELNRVLDFWQHDGFVVRTAGKSLDLAEIELS